MLNKLKNIFQKRKKTHKFGKYTNLSDFMLHASSVEQNKVMKDAAHKANRDQMEIFKKSKLLLKTR